MVFIHEYGRQFFDPSYSSTYSRYFCYELSNGRLSVNHEVVAISRGLGVPLMRSDNRDELWVPSHTIIYGSNGRPHVVLYEHKWKRQ